MNSGQTPDLICAWLHEQQLSMLEAIEIISLAYGVVFAAAQIFVESKGCWAEEAEHQEQFRDEFWDALSQDEPENYDERAMTAEELELYYPRVLYPDHTKSV